MGGFRLEPDQYKLIFEDEKLDGLEVTLSGMSMEQVIEFDTVRFSPVKTVQDVTDRTVKISELIAEHVVDWNLVEPDGSPTPHTGAGLRSHDIKVQRAVVAAYGAALTGVTPELGKESTRGVGVGSIPMDALPPNL